MQRNTFPPVADPNHRAHWHVTSVTAFAAVGMAMVSTASPPGWRRVAGTLTGAVAAFVGVTSLLDPDAASAFGTPWALASVLWGGAVIFVSVRDRAASTVS